MRRQRLFSIPILLAAALAGCGADPSDGPDVVPVQGKITRRGQPFAGVTVTYVPLEPDKVSQLSTAVTNAAGEYELIYNRNLMGAVPGKHQVRLLKEDGQDNQDIERPAPTEIVIPKQLTTREVTVPLEGLSGETANFDLDF